MARNDAPIADKINDVETNLFFLQKSLKKNSSKRSHNDTYFTCKKCIAVLNTKHIR